MSIKTNYKNYEYYINTKDVAVIKNGEKFTTIIYKQGGIVEIYDPDKTIYNFLMTDLKLQKYTV